MFGVGVSLDIQLHLRRYGRNWCVCVCVFTGFLVPSQKVFGCLGFVCTVVCFLRGCWWFAQIVLICACLIFFKSGSDLTPTCSRFGL